MTIYREQRRDPFEHMFRDIDIEDVWNSAGLSCPSRSVLLGVQRGSDDEEFRRRLLGYMRYHVEVRRCLRCRAELTNLSLQDESPSGMN